MTSTDAAPGTSAAGRHRSSSPRGATVDRQRPARGAGRLLLRWTAWLAVLVALAAFAFLAVGPHLFGYRTATMLTGSMEPMIAPGDVVVSVPRPVAEVAVGDVISYHIPIEDRRVETHRVVEVSTAPGGQPVVRTQGDANDAPDSWTAVLEGDVVWQTTAVVPHLGTVIRSLRHPLMQGWLFYGAMAGLLVLGITMIWRGDSSRTERP